LEMVRIDIGIWFQESDIWPAKLANFVIANFE
jgi:hypothetical protein